MDLILSSFSIWNQLPAPIKLLTFSPNFILLPIQISTQIYKGYKWLYPTPPETIILVIDNIELVSSNDDVKNDDKNEEYIMITKYKN
jgi:hypothetical protein